MENKVRKDNMSSTEREQLTTSILRRLQEADDSKLMKIYLFVLHIL